MSELIKEFDGKTITEWIEWYSERYPNAVDNATEKIWDMYETMKGAFNAITKDMVENWVKDLVYGKTYCGIRFQTAIISAIANQLNKDWREANPDEETKGIDDLISEFGDIRPYLRMKSFDTFNRGVEKLSQVVDAKSTDEAVKKAYIENVFTV